MNNIYKILVVLLFFSFSAFTFAADSGQKPLINIVATGGTIAGVASTQTSESYKAGSLTAQQLIASVPDISKYMAMFQIMKRIL